MARSAVVLALVGRLVAVVAAMISLGLALCILRVLFLDAKVRFYK